MGQDKLEALLALHMQQDEENFKKLDKVQSDVAEIKLALASQKGFIAGVVAVVTAIATVIGLAVTAWFK